MHLRILRNILLFCLLVYLLLCNSRSLIAQVSNNPFELKFKKEQIQTTPLEVVSDSQTVAQDSVVTGNSVVVLNKDQTAYVATDNPFDIKSKPPTDKTTLQQPNISTKPLVTDSTTTKAPTTSNESGFMFWVLLGILLIFSSLIGASRTKLNQLSSSFWNENFLRQIHRGNQGSFSFTYLLLYALALVNVGIFFFLLSQYFNWNIPDSLLFLGKIIGSVFVIFIGKHLLLSLVSYIFPIHKEISLYSFTIMVFGIILGLFLLPINILIAYAPTGIGKLIVYISLGAIIAIYLFRLVRGLSIGSKYLVLHKFHFFIYLCTVEILPVIVLLKILDNYTGISFI